MLGDAKDYIKGVVMGKWNRNRITPFGKQLEILLAENDLSQADLARKTGVSRQAIHSVKYSKYPRVRTIAAVARALNVPVSHFLDSVA